MTIEINIFTYPSFEERVLLELRVGFLEHRVPYQLTQTEFNVHL